MALLGHADRAAVCFSRRAIASKTGWTVARVWFESDMADVWNIPMAASMRLRARPSPIRTITGATLIPTTWAW